ncbi:flagellin [Deferribacterales bacterium RsTz2092]|nr:flagellin [Deferribacterales bacterium]
MSISVYTNVYSAIAQNNLNSANDRLGKSIERLSSGLRINHASDDASGLAISEKLRTQLSALTKAQNNAQDAISFLQTAEDGMEVVGDMLQRMRELAVQAGNGAFTTNDRRELQKEFDQLKEEINRVANAAEFNTKKLLSGETAGLWSASSSDVDVIFRAAPAEGNYKLTFDAEAGTNAVYKTNVMSLSPVTKEGTLPSMTLRSTNTSGMNNFNGDGDLRALDGAVMNFVNQPALPIAGGSFPARAVYHNGIAGRKYFLPATPNTYNRPPMNGFLAFEFNEDVANVSGNSGTVKATFTDAATGAVYTANVSYSYTSSSVITFDNTTMGFANGLSWVSSTNTAAWVVENSVVAGDKVLFCYGNGNGNDSSSANVNASVNMAIETIGDSATLYVSDTQSDTPYIGVDPTQGGSYTAVNIVNGEFVTATVRWDRNYSKPDITGSVRLSAIGVGGNVAYSDVQLKDISVFYNAESRMLLDNTQTLSIYGNNKSADIYLESEDTLTDLVAKLANAIDTLGMAGTLSASELVKFVEASATATSGNYAMPGTIVFQTALTGKKSELRFVGDEILLNALGIAQIQEATASSMNVTVTDVHTGKLVGSDTVSDYMLRGVIKGVDINFASNIGLKTSFNADEGKVIFTSTTETANIHIADNATKMQLGTRSEYISIGRMDTTALEINDVYLVTQADAEEALTKIDSALERANHTRSTIGALINRFEQAQKSISTTRQNTIAVESHIRDLDVADESSKFTTIQILVNSAAAMLAQANTVPQMALQLVGR